MGGHQRPRAGNEHRILPVPAVQHCLGPLVFKERLTPMQKVATVLAAVGVGYFMMAHGGQIWIAFALALTFGVYGAVKKRGGYPALPGMAFESLLTGAHRRCGAARGRGSAMDLAGCPAHA